MAERIINAAVFENKTRRYRNVDVEYDETEIRLLNRNTEVVVATYEIAEVAKAGEAWDVKKTVKDQETRVRVVVQVGCGCSGQKQYRPDSSYSGALKN